MTEGIAGIKLQISQSEKTTVLPISTSCVCTQIRVVDLSPFPPSSHSASRSKRTSEGASALTSNLYLMIAIKYSEKDRQKKVNPRNSVWRSQVPVKKSKAACKSTKERCGQHDNFKRTNEPRPSSQKLNEDMQIQDACFAVTCCPTHVNVSRGSSAQFATTGHIANDLKENKLLCVICVVNR